MAAKKKPKKRSYGALLIEALEEAVAIEQGLVQPVKVTRLTARKATAAPAPTFSGAQIITMRQAVGLSQAVFAEALNVSLDTVRSWEQDRRPPSGAALRLLELSAKHPEWLRESIALRATGSGTTVARTDELNALAAKLDETLRIARESQALIVAQITTTMTPFRPALPVTNAVLPSESTRAGATISEKALDPLMH
jgi:putative transcriptional regulator